MLFFKPHILFLKLEPWWLWWFLFKLWFTLEQYKSWISFMINCYRRFCHSRWWQNDITQQVKKLTLSHYKQMIGINRCIGINRWLVNLPMLQVSPCHVLTYYFVLSFKLWSWCFKIFFGKINIYVPLPPVHIQGVWNYCQANVKNIKYLSVEERMNVLTKHY